MDSCSSDRAVLREPEAAVRDGLLPCLSILQPYAWLIVNGHKDIENRGWATKFRGRVLIHAGKKYSRRDHDEFAEDLAEDFPHRKAIVLPSFEEMQLGGIVGSATITDCVMEHPSPWKILGSWGFVLAQQRVRPFVPYRGQLGFFRVPASAISGPSQTASGCSHTAGPDNQSKVDDQEPTAGSSHG